MSRLGLLERQSNWRRGDCHERERTRDAVELEIYWSEIRSTFAGHEVKVLASYGAHEDLEGPGTEVPIVFAVEKPRSRRGLRSRLDQYIHTVGGLCWFHVSSASTTVAPKKMNQKNSTSCHICNDPVI